MRISSPTSMSTMCSSKSSGRGSREPRRPVLDRLLGGATAAFSPERRAPRPQWARRSGEPDRFVRVDSAPDLQASPGHWEADVLLRDGGVGPPAPDPARRRRRCSSSSTRARRRRSKYYRFFSAMPQLTEREVERTVGVDNHRPRRAGADGRRADHRARPVRAARRRRGRRGRGRLPGPGRATSTAASASCCSSTSPRSAASSASRSSSPRSCRRTPGCSRSSATPATASAAASTTASSTWSSPSTPP